MAPYCPEPAGLLHPAAQIKPIISIPVISASGGNTAYLYPSWVPDDVSLVQRSVVKDSWCVIFLI